MSQRQNTSKSDTEISPQKVREQDTAKLHAEINQYINHCFVIAMTAITVFGLVGGWIISGFANNPSSTARPQAGPMTFLISALLIVILLVLFFASQVTSNKTLMIAAYLRITGASKWEEHMNEFRAQGRPWFTESEDILSVPVHHTGVIC